MDYSLNAPDFKRRGVEAYGVAIMRSASIEYFPAPVMLRPAPPELRVMITTSTMNLISPPVFFSRHYF
jgi:hypothetical protein